jgi:hypothetical protein
MEALSLVSIGHVLAATRAAGVVMGHACAAPSKAHRFERFQISRVIIIVARE